MGRKNPPHFVNRETLEQLLGDHAQLKKTGKDELALLALDNGFISNDEFDASVNSRCSTIYSYLWTHVSDAAYREQIEKYVQAYSRLYTRGSWLANLAAIRALEVAPQLPEHFPVANAPGELLDPPAFLMNENDVKTCFLPERWLLKGHAIHQQVLEAYDQHRDRLDALLPDYGAVMSDCGWDNALNHMGTSYLGNAKTMILSSLSKRIEKYVKNVYPKHPSTNGVGLWLTIRAPLSPSNNVANSDFEWAIHVRNCLGVSLDAWFETPENFSSYVWTLHLWLQRRLAADPDKQFSLLPVSKLSRKYAYIDHKVANSLLPTRQKRAMLEVTAEHDGSALQKVMGLTRELWHKRRADVRKRIRQRYRMNAEGKEKMRAKWKRIGRGCLPKRASVQCIRTDGVGLRLCLEFKPTEKEVRARVQSSERIGKCGEEECRSCNNGCHSSHHSQSCAFCQSAAEQHLAGADTGRVRMITCADQDGRVCILGRRGYYRRLRHYSEKRVEDARRIDRQTGTQTPYGAALNAVSASGGFRNASMDTWIAAMDATVTHVEILVQEQIVDRTRAMFRMRRFRTQKAYFDQRIKQLIRPSMKRPDRWLDPNARSRPSRTVTLGIGDGMFPSTGRGEQAVPTTSISTHLKRVLRVHSLVSRVNVRQIVETNTTKCCHRCHAVMETRMTAHGRECLRYRWCTNCAESNGKRRNRDVNAAKNILKLLELELAGQPRPAAFRPVQNVDG